MKAVVIITGGMGANLMKAQVANELTAKYESVYLCTPYRNCGEAFSMSNKKLKVVSPNELTQLFATIMRDPENWMVYNLDPYKDGDFMLRRANFYNIARKQCGLETLPEDDDENGAETMPVLPENPQLEKQAQEFSKQHKKFVLFCRKGGMSPLIGPDGRRGVPGPESGLLREYPVRESEWLVSLLNAKGYEVLQVCLPEEAHIKGCITLQQEVPMEFYAELAKYAKGVITIDSSLMHFAIFNCKKMVVMWRETNARAFGYKKAINLYSEDYVPTAPLFSGIPDTPVATPVDPEKVVEAFDKQ